MKERTGVRKWMGLRREVKMGVYFWVEEKSFVIEMQRWRENVFE